MSSIWPSALASLDRSSAALDPFIAQLESGRPIDLSKAVERLKTLAESSEHLRGMLAAEVPQAEWQDRKELASLVAARDVEHQRARLRALADDLQNGTVTHRRAARVTQMTQLRDEAIEELRSRAAAQPAPPTLPGPPVSRWITWACALKEPEDTAALQSLRSGYSVLDEFVASLEPGMWVTGAASAALAEAEEEAAPAVDPVIEAKDLEHMKARLLGVAVELERGSVVHHRGARVTQVNQLRDQAIQELRFQAVVARMPATLPGPDAGEWVRWACGLQEPEDAEDLQSLREGFPHLDEFVANLEPGMWTQAAPSAPVVAAPVAEKPAVLKEKEKPAVLKEKEKAAGQKEKPAVHKKEEAASSRDVDDEPPRRPPARVEPRVEPRVVATAAAAAGAAAGATKMSGAQEMLSGLPPKVTEFWRTRWRILLPTTVALLIILFAAMQWRLHRTHANAPVRVEAKAPDVTVAPPPIVAPTVTMDVGKANSKQPNPADKNAKPNDKNAAQPATPPTDQQKKPSLIDDATLRTPQAIPKSGARTEEASLNTSDAGGVPGALSGVGGGVPSVVNDVPATQPRIAGQKIRVSSGVAQGQLIRQVPPVYPVQARLAGIHGTVVLQAVIGKDGAVQNVHAVSGPSMLIPSAVDAVKQWRYRPFSLNGEAAEADIQINLNFTP